MKAKEKSQVNSLLPTDLARQLRIQAIKEGRRPSNIVAEAVESYLHDRNKPRISDRVAVG